MTDSELKLLKADFLKWSGGFEPEGEDNITVYLIYAMPFDIDPEEVRAALREWIAEVSVE